MNFASAAHPAHFVILSIYPRRLATHIGLFHDDDERSRHVIKHSEADFPDARTVADQWPARLTAIESALANPENGMGFARLDAVVGPGGVLDRVPSGVYSVDKPLLDRLKLGTPFSHPANLGAYLADGIARLHGCEAYVADPVTTNESDEIARTTGLPIFSFGHKCHALSIKSSIRRAAAKLGKNPADVSLIVGHLGKSFTICAYANGKMIDATNANERGPFSPSRSGGVPATGLVRMAHSGTWVASALLRRVSGKGGLVGYLGTDDMREVRRMIDEGNERASVVYGAMAYQIAQEIGAQATVLRGKVDAIVLSGGCACDDAFVELVRKRAGWIAPIITLHRGDELLDLATAVLPVLRKEEAPKSYAKAPKV